MKAEDSQLRNNVNTRNALHHTLNTHKFQGTEEDVTVNLRCLQHFAEDRNQIFE